MKLYPLMVDLTGKKVTVIGGGSVALRKITDLVDCGAVITVISPHIHDDIKHLQTLHENRISLLERRYRPGDLEGTFLVFTATDDSNVNGEVYDEANDKEILINMTDSPSRCSFFVPSWVNKDGLILAVSTSGASPAFSARLRREMEGLIPERMGDILSAVKEIRSLLKGPDFSHLTSQERGSILKKIIHSDHLINEMLEHYTNGSIQLYLKKIIQ